MFKKKSSADSKDSEKVLSKDGKALKITQVTVAILLLLFAFGLTKIQKNIAADKAGEIITFSTDRPDENKPGIDYDWRGNSTDPKKLKIESIALDAYMQKVGVDQNKQVAVPNNIHIAGWFVDSAKVGENGLSIIDGHVDGLSSGGVFSKLNDVKIGDKIAIERGDGRIINYEVIASKTVPLADAQSVLYSQDPSVTSQINLVTCVGNYDKTAKTYDHRVIVSAKKEGVVQ